MENVSKQENDNIICGAKACLTRGTELPSDV